MDQYGDEFISERTPGSMKTENGNGQTDQNIPKYESFLKLNYQISDVFGAWGYEKPKVTISSSGQISYILPDVLGFKVTVTAPSGQSDSLFVYMYQ